MNSSIGLLLLTLFVIIAAAIEVIIEIQRYRRGETPYEIGTSSDNTQNK